jgi:hypothetical protein
LEGEFLEQPEIAQSKLVEPHDDRPNY